MVFKHNTGNISMSGRDEVKKLIAQKMKRTNKIKERTQEGLTPRDIIVQFLTDIEVIYGIEDYHEYHDKLVTMVRDLNRKMRWFDSYIYLEVLWNDTTSEIRHQDLRVTGVQIRWSNRYLQYRDDHPKEQIIDISDVLLDNPIE